MATGTVKFFNEQKGFGFICPDDGSKDIFVHRSNVRTPDKLLRENQRVTYDVGQGQKGPEANNVYPS